MTFTTIESTRQGSIALIGLNRPEKLNAINATMIAEINIALDQIEADDSILSIVVHGKGRAFSAGFDLQAGVAAKRETEADWQAAIDTDLDLIMRFWHSSKPTIAALHGYVLAGGFEIALACDMSVCDSATLFGEPELRFGSSIVALLLPWYVNPKRAKRMLLSGQDRMTADEALRFGIVNDVVTEGEALSAGLALAHEVTRMDPDSVRMTKQAINQSYEIMGLSQALRMGANTSVKIETLETDLRRQFNAILREQGMQAALAWREARLDKDD
jgi:enoyl-CoA hydratase